jgi:hypothetical protein
LAINADHENAIKAVKNSSNRQSTSYYESKTEIRLKKSLYRNEDSESSVDAEDIAKKAEQDLGQDVYNNLMKEMALEQNSRNISHENLGLLLFMT